MCEFVWLLLVHVRMWFGKEYLSVDCSSRGILLSKSRCPREKRVEDSLVHVDLNAPSSARDGVTALMDTSYRRGTHPSVLVLASYTSG